MSDEATTVTISRPVGPVMQSGEIARAVAQAAEIDNPGRTVTVRDRGSYVRIEVDGGECILRRATIESELGRPFRLAELEVNMPSFVGRIDTGTEIVRFYLGKQNTSGFPTEEAGK